MEQKQLLLYPSHRFQFLVAYRVIQSSESYPHRGHGVGVGLHLLIPQKLTIALGCSYCPVARMVAKNGNILLPKSVSICDQQVAINLLCPLLNVVCSAIPTNLGWGSFRHPHGDQEAVKQKVLHLQPPNPAMMGAFSWIQKPRANRSALLSLLSFLNQ